jgi:hypothetical protein
MYDYWTSLKYDSTLGQSKQKLAAAPSTAMQTNDSYTNTNKAEHNSAEHNK